MGSKPGDYLDASAGDLKVQYQNCAQYIDDLLAKYKKTLKEGVLDIGSTPQEVIGSFEKDVRKHCERTKNVEAIKPNRAIRK